MIREAKPSQKITKALGSVRRNRLPSPHKQGLSTYCPQLWDTAYIDELGNVFPCCLCVHQPSGNICHTPLAKIWGNQYQRTLRQDSLSGVLPCYSICTILSPEQKHTLPSTLPPIDHPKNVHIQFTNFCTLDCIMCNQEHHNAASLDSEALKNNVDWNKVSMVYLQGGEILAHRKGREIFRWLTEEKNRSVNLITNGVYLNARWAQRLCQHSQWVEVSINAATHQTHERINQGSHFETVINNLRTLVRTKKRLASPLNIRYHVTIVQENVLEIPDAILLAEKLGCDTITFTFDPGSVPLFLLQHPELKNEVSRKIEKLASRSGKHILIRSNHLSQLGLLKRSAYPHCIDNC